MILCLCNALTEAEIGDAIARGADRPREVYAACACKAQCGRCTRAILAILRDAAPRGSPAAGRTAPA